MSVVWLLSRLRWFCRNDRVYGHIDVVAFAAPLSELVFSEARVELAPGFEGFVLFRHRRTYLLELLLTIGDFLLTSGLVVTSLIPLVTIRLPVLRFAVSLDCT